MNKERQLLHAWLCITPHIVDPMYEKIYKTTKELLAQPEPKQKPLSDKYIAHGFRCSNEATHADSFWAGVEYAEKAHGIGGGE